jgi:hypothetical protein
VPAAFGGGTVELTMDQVEITVGWTYKFNAEEPAAQRPAVYK